MSAPGRRPATVAVTGAAGFVGRHVVTALARRGHAVLAYDLVVSASVRYLDVRRPVPARAFQGADTVIHLAALGGVAPSLAEPERYATTNVDGTAEVLAAAERAGVGRVVVASSSSVYGHCAEPAVEMRALRPLSPYAWSKVAAEGLARAHAGRGLEVAVVRPFTVFGPGQRPDMLIGRLLAGEPLTLWEFERDFTPVHDVAEAVAAACTAPLGSPYEVFNLGSGRPVGAAELVTAVAEVTGRSPAVAWGRPRSGEPARTWPDATRARERLGFDVSRSLVDGLAEQMAARPEGRAGMTGGALVSSAG